MAARSTTRKAPAKRRSPAAEIEIVPDDETGGYGWRLGDKGKVTGPFRSISEAKADAKYEHPDATVAGVVGSSTFPDPRNQ